MIVQLRIEYEQVVDLVEQLPPEQQEALLVHILSMRAGQRPLTPDEKIQLLDAAKLDNPVARPASVRRRDWYGKDVE